MTKEVLMQRNLLIWPLDWFTIRKPIFFVDTVNISLLFTADGPNLFTRSNKFTIVHLCQTERYWALKDCFCHQKHCDTVLTWLVLILRVSWLVLGFDVAWPVKRTGSLQNDVIHRVMICIESVGLTIKAMLSTLGKRPLYWFQKKHLIVNVKLGS